MDTANRDGMKRSWKYGAAGLLLGLGCPAGLLLVRHLAMYGQEIAGRMLLELELLRLIYIYSAAGCALVFSAFGYVLGRYADRLAAQTRSLAQAAETLQSLCITDALTGLYNPGYMRKRLDQEAARARRYRYALGCLFIDVDNFKSLNDRYGHPYGDSVLARIAKSISAATRDTDVLGRFGGDEFLVILPSSDEQAALRIAERIRKSVETAHLREPEAAAGATVSIGVYAAHEFLPPAALVDSADRALREAKLTGKNRCVLIGLNERGRDPALAVHQ